MTPAVSAEFEQRRFPGNQQQLCLPEPSMSRARLIACVLLPFAAGYYLSYLFRTINALIAIDLTTELKLSAGDLGFLTSVYFLIFTAVQLPFGALLDRYGPRTIQSTLLLLTSAGALVFALADDFLILLFGRALIGLGVATALMSGFKAIVLWFPPERLALANGWLVMLGALGALTATGPAELIIQSIGWRGLFALLAGLSALAALLVLFAVPEPSGSRSAQGTVRTLSLWAIYRDRRFWRIAPLSAIGIGTSWSLQGLWAAPWLRDVDGLERASIVQHLSVMAVAVCANALLLGTVADRLRRMGIKTELLLASTLTVSMAAQMALVFQWPVPSFLVWQVIAAAGAATVLSFAILTQYFPKEMSGRANAALNLLHVGGAFVLQSATGFIIEQWPEAHGTYPAEAHQVAMAVPLMLQLAALAWFATPRRLLTPATGSATCQSARVAHAWPTTAPTPYTLAALAWTQHVDLVRKQVTGWRSAAAASVTLCVGLAAALTTTLSRPAVAVHILEVDRSAYIPVDPSRFSATGPIDDLAAIELARSAEGPPWRAPDLVRWAFVRPEPIVRPSAVTLANSARSQR
jgi:MFS family permease